MTDTPSIPAAVAETHMSVILFVGDRAYKIKKPVAFPFADFRDRAVREAVCHREVELNRRLAPDVYLGVADVLGFDGEPEEHIVVMRRMPDDRRLTRLIEADDPSVPGMLDALVRQLAAFHAGAERSAVIDRAGEPGAIASRWADNFDELRPFVGTVLDADDLERAETLVRAFLTGRDALFLGRIDEGQICDGHGDLQTDDVFCLDDGPRALDCIEFCDEFRYGDVVADVAFLAMDLDRLGAPHLAERFIAAYAVASGRPVPPALLHLSVAYRAQVRAKVTCLRSRQHPVGSADEKASRESARRLLDLCIQHLAAAQVRLVVVGGLPGTGKSTVARAVRTDLGAELIRSDVVRKERAGIDPLERAGTAFGTGLYDAGTTDRTYRHMVDAAAEHLASGRSVVLDASFATEAHRRLVRQLASTVGAELTEICCVLDPHEAGIRMVQRLAHARDPSDATPEVATAMASAFDRWPEAFDLATAADPDDVAVRALALVGHPRDASRSGSSRVQGPSALPAHRHPDSDGSDRRPTERTRDMTKTIVIPLDGSETAERAVPVAAAFARRLGADLHLVMTSFEPDDTTDADYLATQTSAAGPDVTSELVPFVLPSRGIVDAVDSRTEAVLCMTTRGRGKVAQALLGGVADEVLRETTSPVVLVGPSCRSIGSDADEIVLCVDQTHGATALMAVVSDWAQRLDLLVHLVTVDTLGTTRGSSHPPTDALLAAAAATLSDRGVRNESHVLESTHAGDVLVAFADARHAGLIALGTRNQSSALGRVTGQVVRHSHCPVLIHR